MRVFVNWYAFFMWNFVAFSIQVQKHAISNLICRFSLLSFTFLAFSFVFEMFIKSSFIVISLVLEFKCDVKLKM